MSLSIIEQKSQPKHNLLLNYNVMLAESIENLVAETHRESPNFTHFINACYEMMQSKIDPPLESIWVYSALTFRSRNLTNDDPVNRLSATKDLFELISACSGSCSPSKSIALLAPVVFELYNVVAESKRRALSSKREKKLIREVKSLVDVILGFISLCSCRNLDEQSDAINVVDSNLIVPFKDLVSLWIDRDEHLESFLPLVSAGICREHSDGVSDVDYLAGVVILEIFLMKLCLNFAVRTPGAQLEKELKSWVVGSITGFQNAYFFESLLRMMLEPTLCVTSLLSSEDEVVVKKVLYDAVILVEYGFLNPERAVHLPAERRKSLAMTRLIVTHEAIELSREDEDQKRAISYADAFSSSKLLSETINWITSQIGLDEKASRSFGSSPRTLLKWLLSLENQGIRVFDDRILKSRAKIAIDNSKADYKPQSSKVEGKFADSDLLFYVDSNGEVEHEDEDEEQEQKKMNESMSAAFLAAAHSMKMMKNGGTKRKQKGTTGKKKKIKYCKFDLSNNYDTTKERFSSVIDEGLSSSSELEEPISDEEVETEEQ